MGSTVDDTRQEMERVFAEQLTKHTVQRFRKLDAVIDGSFRIARDLIETAFKDALLRYFYLIPQLDTSAAAHLNNTFASAFRFLSSSSY